MPINESALFSCEWLKQNLDAKNQVILDATFFLPRQQRCAEEEYQQQHIPNAQFFDIDTVADLSHSLSHMLPKPDSFAAAVEKMGIANDTQVVIYDNNHFFAAARVWWMFRVFGHKQVYIIDGGIARWKQLNFPVSSEQPNPLSFQKSQQNFVVQYRPELVFNLKKMIWAQQNQSAQIIDARSADSFLGQRKLVDSSLQSGHIPGSSNIPYVSLTDSSTQMLLGNIRLRTLFEQANINLSNAIVTTCGSGVSAAVLSLALYQLGFKNIPLYDGSWTEWGRQPDTAKQTHE